MGERRSWSWTDLAALPAEDISVDLHCLTRWSKLGTHWRRVSLDTILEDVDTAAGFAMVDSYGGYTTNLPVPDLLDGQAWIATTYDARISTPNTAAPLVCWCRTSTSGRARSGSAGSR